MCCRRHPYEKPCLKTDGRLSLDSPPHNGYTVGMANIGIDARLSNYRVGGISTYTRMLIGALEKIENDHTFTVFQSRRAKHTMTSALTEQFVAQKLWTPPHHRLERWLLSLELSTTDLDVLHSPDFIPPQWGARRMVITVHDLTFLRYPEHKDLEGSRYYTRQINWAVKRADHILSVSNATKRDLIDMLDVPEDKITVQPHGVHTREYPMLQGTGLGNRMVNDWLNDGAFPQEFILHVGTIEPRKNIPALLDAYMELRARWAEAPPLLLVGQRGWLYEDIVQQIETLRKDGAPILWRDDVSNDQLSLIYNRAAVLVMPSLYEGFGLPPLEAMAAGTPVIVSNTSSLPEVVGDAGLLIDPEDPGTITAALERALTDQTWREAARRKGLAQAAKFSWENSARIALGVYEHVLTQA